MQMLTIKYLLGRTTRNSVADSQSANIEQRIGEGQ